MENMTIHDMINSRSWMSTFGYGRFKRLKEELDCDYDYAIEYGINICPYYTSKECRLMNKKIEFKQKF